MKTKYYKNSNNLYYQSFSKKGRITVDLYSFYTAITIRTCNFNNTDISGMIECTKLEFDKAYNLALALISNKSLNK